MIRTENENKDSLNRLKKEYTIDNKDIDRKEAMLNRNLPHERKIYLYTKENWYIYFPKWAFNDILQTLPKNKLDEVFSYNWTLSEEQSYILNHLKNQRTWLINLKTWRGKTHIIMGLINQKQEKTLILVHSTKTLEEMEEKFKEYTNNIPWVYYSKKKDIKDITITTHKSFVADNDKFNEFSLLVYDECDYNLSKKMIDTINKFDSSSIFWLTGTPKTQEMDEKDLQKIYWYMYQWIGELYNVYPKIWKLKYTNHENFSFDSWHELRDNMMNNEDRINKQKEFIKNTTFTYWLLLTERKEEAKKYYEILSEELDIPVLLFTWDTKTHEDSQRLDNARQNRQYLIIGTAGKMSRWVDIPEVESIFLFYPCQFKWQVVQAVGRALRTHWEKTEANVYDWNDLPILKGQANKRLQAYKEEYNHPPIYSLSIN